MKVMLFPEIINNEIKFSSFFKILLATFFVKDLCHKISSFMYMTNIFMNMSIPRGMSIFINPSERNERRCHPFDVWQQSGIF